MPLLAPERRGRKRPRSVPRVLFRNVHRACDWSGRLAVYSSWMLGASVDSSSRGLQYTYAPTDFETARRKLANGSIQVMGSDFNFTANQLERMVRPWLLPTLAQAIVVLFNLPNITELEIPGEVLADVFSGRIRQWSGLATWNPALAGLRQNISLVVRSDASGTSEAFTRALSSFSTEWRTKVGVRERPVWPRADMGCEGDGGVAACVIAHTYSLGYASQAGLASLKLRCSVAKIGNKAGTFVAPSAGGVVAAMNAFAADLTDRFFESSGTIFYQNLVDPDKSEPDAYPISTLTYFAFDAGALQCDELHGVLYLIYWAWTNHRTNPSAKQAAEEFGATPISPSLSDILIRALGRIQCNGENMLNKLLKELSAICPRGATSLSPFCEQQ